MSVYLSVCLSVCLPACLPARLSVCLSAHKVVRGSTRRFSESRYLLDQRRGSDDALQQLEDEPVRMPFVFCLLGGCEDHLFQNGEQLIAHCEECCEGFQTYRLQCLRVISKIMV